MSATFIEKIRAYLQRPMIEQSAGEEALGCLMILLIGCLIWWIGELIDRWEGRR